MIPATDAATVISTPINRNVPSFAPLTPAASRLSTPNTTMSSTTTIPTAPTRASRFTWCSSGSTGIGGGLTPIDGADSTDGADSADAYGLFSAARQRGQVIPRGASSRMFQTRSQVGQRTGFINHLIKPPT